MNNDDTTPDDWAEGPPLEPGEELLDDLADQPPAEDDDTALAVWQGQAVPQRALITDEAEVLGTPYTSDGPPMTLDGTILPEPIPDDPSPVLPAQVSAFIRTVAPFLVTWLVAGASGLSELVSGWLGFQLGIPEGLEVWLATGVPVVLGAAYYALARVLERRWPRVPWLGSTRQPLYTPRATKASAVGVMSLAATGYVWYKGGKFSPAFRDMLVELDRLTPDVPIVITQGGFNGLTVSASAGTHAGDAVDISVRGLTQAQVTKLISTARQLGLAASFRTTRVGKWGTRAQGFSSYHVHGIPNGWGAPSAAARRQVAYTDANGVKRGYRYGRDGLASNGADLGPGHTGAFRLRTWAGYLAAKNAPKPPAPGLPITDASGWDGTSYPGAGAFILGKSHPAVTVLGHRLQVHGFGRFYSVGPGPVFGLADKDATRAFQLSRSSLKGDADGYPGPATWAALMAAPPVPSTVLKVGSRGAAVGNLQRGLNRVFPRYSSLKVDGIFGAATAGVVKTCQRKAGLAVDGVVGPVTRAKLASMGVRF